MINCWLLVADAKIPQTLFRRVGTLPTNNQITAWAIFPPYNTTRGGQGEEKACRSGFSPTTQVGFKPDLQTLQRK